mmetsp:Transcript_24540/g.75806  ORF Transcript_24540/g.75806 Transcript_24540/m.75806 type:complete len:207 (+) Transcript_24540:42-662(+)
MAHMLDSSADKNARRMILWRVLPSKGLVSEKEKTGGGYMFVDEEGRLRVESEDLGMSITIKLPEGTSFEFMEEIKGYDLDGQAVANLSWSGGSFFSKGKGKQSWAFYLIVEGCDCKLLAAKSSKKQAIDTFQRTCGFAQDEEGRKVVLFKEDGHRSPIFEFVLGGAAHLVAKGAKAIMTPVIQGAMAKLQPADASKVVAPARAAHP